MPVVCYMTVYELHNCDFVLDDCYITYRICYFTVILFLLFVTRLWLYLVLYYYPIHDVCYITLIVWVTYLWFCSWWFLRLWLYELLNCDFVPDICYTTVIVWVTLLWSYSWCLLNDGDSVFLIVWHIVYLILTSLWFWVHASYLILIVFVTYLILNECYS